MSPKCPKCSIELKDDYGMLTCSGCGSIVFVDMDGKAQVADELPADIEVGEIESLPPLEPMSFEPEPMGELEPMAVELLPRVPDSSDVDMNAFLGYTPDAMPPASSHNDPSDPLGLSAYANSEMSAAKNGPLVVTLIISGIDAKDLRDEVRQALQDSRFGWDTAALMSSIKGGILRIEQVSPVKATIIINRIKNLAVRIRWEQSAITEIDPTS